MRAPTDGVEEAKPADEAPAEEATPADEAPAEEANPEEAKPVAESPVEEAQAEEEPDIDREPGWWADYHGKDPRPSMDHEP